MSRLASFVLIVGAMFLAQSALAQNLLNGPQGCIYDSVYNRYLVTNFWGQSVVEIDPLGNQSYFASGLPRCMSICIVDTIVYVSTETSLMAFNLATRQPITLPLSNFPPPLRNYDGLAADKSENLYLLDVGGRVIKIRLNDYVCSRFVSSGIAVPAQDIAFDITNNRLLVDGWISSGPIQAVQIIDSSVSTVVAVTMGLLDGIALDRFGNVYVSSHAAGGYAYCYRRGLTKPPELICESPGEPSGLDFNNRDNILAVPNFYTNRLDLVPVDLYPGVIGWDFRDDGGGDDDGICEAGETIELVLTVGNFGWSEASDVRIKLLPVSTALVVSNTEAYLGDIPAGDSVHNGSTPFTFTIPIDHVPSLDSFHVELSYDKNGPIIDTFSIRQAIGAPRLLLVDDDHGDDLERFYYPHLEHLSIPYARLDASQPFSSSDLSAYDLVVWFTGDERAEPISGDDMAAMQGYLDAGKLFLTGQRIAAQLSGSGQSDFLNDYLRCTYLSTAIIPAVLSGTDDSRILSIDDSLWMRGAGGANNQTAPDHISAVNGGLGELAYIYQTDLGAVSYIGAYQLLFFSFGFEGIVDGYPQYLERETVMAHILDFFHYRRPAAMRLTVSPGNQMRLTDHTPSIGWSYDIPLYNQQAFHVQVGSNNEWSAAEMWDYGPVSGSDTVVLYAGGALMDGDDYFYRVRVSDGSEWSSWYYGQMRMNTMPTMPADLIPDNGLQLPATPPYLLSHANAVDADGDPVRYSYAVYDDSLMMTLVAQASDQPENPGGTTSWQLAEILPGNEDYFWRVRAGDGYENSPWSPLASFYIVSYVCGDANGDGQANVADAVFLINYVFKGGDAPEPVEAGDANCDGQPNVADAVYLINYVFKGGAAPCAGCP